MDNLLGGHAQNNRQRTAQTSKLLQYEIPNPMILLIFFSGNGNFEIANCSCKPPMSTIKCDHSVQQNVNNWKYSDYP